MTTNYTTFISKNETTKLFFDKICLLDENYKKITTVLTEELHQLNKDTYHFLIQFLKPKTRIEHIFCNHLLSSMYKAEVVSQGGGPVSFIFCLAFSKHLLQNEALLKTNEYTLMSAYEASIENIKTIIEKQAKPICKDKLLEKLTETCYEDKIIAQVVYEAIMLAGLEGKVFIEDGKQSNFIIEQKTGHPFSLKPYKYLLDNEKTWDRNKVKLLLVDGFVEKVSELDHILQEIFTTKQSLAIISHGFSEEVIATIKINQQRGNLDICPIRIKSDLEGINTMADLAAVCNTTPISSFKGDLLALIKYEDLPEIEKIRVGLKETVIENFSPALNSHIKMLLEKRAANLAIEDVQELIDKRLRSMVSSGVVIYLPETSALTRGTTRVKIDNALRASKTLLNYGIVNIDSFLKEIKAENTLMDLAVLSGIKEMSGYFKDIPALSLYVALVIAGKSMLNLLSASGSVVLE